MRLVKALAQEGIALAFPIEARVKTWSSLRDKLLSLNPQAVEDVQDIVGFRLVTLFHRHVLAASQAVQASGWFRIIREYDTVDSLEVDRFGYSSTHLIVELPHAPGQPDDSPSLKAEVQIRSVAQHLWATASHTLQYKREGDVPPPLRRAVHRVAALLETVDQELEHVLVARRQYSEVAADRQDEDFNVDLLKTVLQAIWPSEHQIFNEPFAMLLQDLQRRGITTPRELTATLRPYVARTLAIARREAEHLVFLADRYGVSAGKIAFSETPNRYETRHVDEQTLARARRGVFYSHTGLTWTALGLAAGTHTHLERPNSA